MQTALLGTYTSSRLQRSGTAGSERSKQARLRARRSLMPAIFALRQDTADDRLSLSRGANRFPTRNMTRDHSHRIASGCHLRRAARLRITFLRAVNNSTRARGMPNQPTLNVNALFFRQSANCKHDYGGTVDAQSHCQLVQQFEDVPVESHADHGRCLHGPKFKASASKPQKRLNFSRSFLRSGNFWPQNCAILCNPARMRPG